MEREPYQNSPWFRIVSPITPVFSSYAATVVAISAFNIHVTLNQIQTMNLSLQL